MAPGTIATPQGAVATVVRFSSALADDAVRALFAERAEQYLEVPGLLDKIYLRFRETGEFGAVYVWESESALEMFRRSELARTIADVYRVESAPRSELAEVCLAVRPGLAPPLGNDATG